jgi:hypothetical protein
MYSKVYFKKYRYQYWDSITDCSEGNTNEPNPRLSDTLSSLKLKESSKYN